MKPGDIKSNTYIDFNKRNNKEYTKLRLVYFYISTSNVEI